MKRSFIAAALGVIAIGVLTSGTLARPDPAQDAAEKRAAGADDAMRNRLEQAEQEGGVLRLRPRPEDLPALLRILRRQAGLHRPSLHEKAHPSIRQAYRPVVADALRSTVRIHAGGKPVALGTIVAQDGYILTKASELRGKIECLLPSAKLEAQIVGVHERYDLALLKVDADGLVPAVWSARSPPVGTLLATPGTAKDAIAVGVLSVAPRKPIDAKGFLGVGLEPSNEGVRVSQVVRGSAASDAGLKVGDVILRVDGQQVASPLDMSQAVGSHDAGEQIELGVRRAGQTRNYSATLGTRQMTAQRVRRFNLMNEMGSPLSKRRDGFPYVLEHDSVLLPDQCGGPLVDLRGKVVGVNIARAGRVASYAIPADRVQALLPKLKSGKLTPPPPKPNEQLESLKATLRKARQKRRAGD